MGSFFIIGLIGIIVVSLANIFFQSPAVDFATPFIGVAMGLHVSDTQKLKTIYYNAGIGEMGQKWQCLKNLPCIYILLTYFYICEDFWG